MTIAEQLSGRPVEAREPLIHVVNVSRTFHVGSQEVRALRGINLDIYQGQLVAIRGPSGSGKTTLVNIMGGLDRPTSGQVFYKGHNLGKLSDQALTDLRRREIGFVFQSFALIEVLTAYENVELPLRMIKMSASERSRRVRECLEWVDLGKRTQHRAYELSGGEQQRVGIARALVNQPSLILADEPTAELNQETAQRVMELFRRIVREQNRTVCVVTHDPMVSEYADVTFEIVDGLLVGRNGEGVSAQRNGADGSVGGSGANGSAGGNDSSGLAGGDGANGLAGGNGADVLVGGSGADA